MSNLPASNEKSISRPSTTIILILLLAVVIMGLLTAKKHLVREPTVEPLQNEMTILEEMVNTNPQDADARLGLAYAYQRAKQFDKSKAQYLEVIGIDAKNLAALYNLGVISKEEKNQPEAEKYFIKALTLKPDHVLAAIGLSEIYIAQGKYDDAVETADKALEIHRTIVNLRLIKAEALEKKGDKAAAAAEYREVLRFLPDSKTAKEALTRLK